jgi:CubicO group peptidase (beta-lactamase class C family)
MNKIVRKVLFSVGTVMLASSLSIAASTRPEQPASATNSMSVFDDLMADVVGHDKIPGAALAITKDGRLIYARGFGYADVDEKRPVQPDSLFRIASISKPITAVAIMQLVESRKIKLESKVFDILPIVPHLDPGQKPDPRLKDITVLNLLQHAGGWDRSKSFDPMGGNGLRRVSRALAVPFPPSRIDVIRYMIGLPLDFTPGTRSAYSNFGFLLLGRVIERVTGQTYENYVKQFVLRPLGINAMRIGLTHKENRAPKEVTYYCPGRTTVALFGPQKGQQVSLPYARCIEVMDSHGGWIASAVDLARFTVAFDKPLECKVLREESVRRMFARPEAPWGLDAAGKPKRSYYACGWCVEVNKSGQMSTSHGGGIEGTSASLYRRDDGVNWVLLFNAHNSTLAGQVSSHLRVALDSVRVWPEHDLFLQARSGKRGQE